MTDTDLSLTQLRFCPCNKRENKMKITADSELLER